MNHHANCDLCSAHESVTPYEVGPKQGSEAEILLCSTCHEGIENPKAVDLQHWYCLRDSMWSEKPAVQVTAFRVLKHLSTESFANDLLAQLYLDEATQQWADSMPAEQAVDAPIRIVDANGAVLADGDSVTLIKDLEVKGGGFTAKRGTLVKAITLTDDPKYVEGRVNGIRIVLVAAYLKKA